MSVVLQLSPCKVQRRMSILLFSIQFHINQFLKLIKNNYLTNFKENDMVGFWIISDFVQFAYFLHFTFQWLFLAKIIFCRKKPGITIHTIDEKAANFILHFFELWSKFQKWFFFCKVLLFSSRKDFLSLSLQNFIFQMTFYRFSRRLNRRHFKKYFIYHTIKEFLWNSEWFEKTKTTTKLNHFFIT